MSRKVLFIASVGRSGSTLLDLLLGGHSKFVGVGELHAITSGRQSIDSSRNHRCSCGKIAASCDFWGTIVQEDNIQKTSMLRHQVNSKLDTMYDTDTVMIDSSKNPAALRELALDSGEASVKVIHLVRDIRANYISRLNRDPGFGLKKLAFSRFYYWFKENKKLKRTITELKLDSLTVSYENLCFNPELVLTQICEFMEVDFEPEMLNLESSESHILHGNRMKNDSNKRSSITYDSRWMTDDRWLWPYMMLPFIRRYNRTVQIQSKNKSV